MVWNWSWPWRQTRHESLKTKRTVQLLLSLIVVTRNTKIISLRNYTHEITLFLKTLFNISAWRNQGETKGWLPMGIELTTSTHEVRILYSLLSRVFNCLMFLSLSILSSTRSLFVTIIYLLIFIYIYNIYFHT